MRDDLLDILCCPDCKADLRLEAGRRDPEGEIIEGTLTCVQCKHAYPIEDGIPNLLPPDLEEESR